MIEAAWRRPSITPRLCAGLSAALLALAIVFGRPLSSTMAVHMLGQIPMILLAGVLGWHACLLRLAVRGDRPLYVRLAKYNSYGIPGLLFVTFMLAYWMIPRSLDHALVSAAANSGKFAGLFFAGMLLLDSLRRADKVVKLFFIGNFSWMTAIAGLLYQENPNRLCNFYLLGDQEMAGMGLVILAVMAPVVWLWAEYKRSPQP